jgi:hypothetical protein
MKNEKYLALLGGICGKYWWAKGCWEKEGTPSRVSFDSDLVLKKHQELIGFFHTHPGMSSVPSSIDYGTMGAWTISCGKPLVCCIYGIDGLECHWFIDEETPHITGWGLKIGNVFVGRMPEKVWNILAVKL